MTNFKTLIGTPKQVAWATEIREAAYAKIAAQIEKDRGSKYFDADMEMAALDFITGHFTKAAWWINNRNFIGNQYEIALSCLQDDRDPATVMF